MKKMMIAICGLLIVGGSTFAQDNVVGVPLVIESTQSDDGSRSFSTMSLLSTSPGSVVMAGDMLPGVSFQMGGGPVDGFSLLGNPSVQKDLELLDDQIKQIREIQREVGTKISQHFKKGASLENRRNLRETIKGLMDEQKEKIKGVLLEHQQERLKQVALQMRMKTSGTANALSSDHFAETLGLTEEQIERLKKRAKELKKKMDEKIKKMKEEMKEELIGELSPDQRKKLQEMLGDKYEGKAEDWRSSIRNRVRRIQPRNEDD